MVVAAARLVAGPGCSGKVAIELNPDNADRFIACCLNVLNQSGFRQIAIFGDVDSNNINKDFMILNDYLTIAIALGLTLGEVMLLPMTEINAYKQETLKDEYAPFLAAKIIDPKQRKKIQEWIRNLPPETLAKLFECLIKHQSGRSDNELQVKAIINVMALINPTSNDSINDKCRQFEETLFRMNTNIEMKQSSMAQWNNFGFNWMKIAKFITSYDNYRNRSKELFNLYSNTLCKHMELRKKVTNLLGVENTHYICFNKNFPNVFNAIDMSGYEKVNWDVYEI
ncbi:hypothetical protein [Photobacterium kishitanii]|uniref:hypothetical protein n=1 Tax=Photobacterium kishitanii TaxID=318456 RepID=UPI0011B27BA3|nr:hypothetical protein [Photobacterium kishitanii]